MFAHFRSRFPIIFGLIILFVGIFVGERWGLYYIIPNFDKVLHALGGLAVAWMAMAVLQDDIRNMRRLKRLLILVSVTALVGVVWEFAEYLGNFSRTTYPAIYHYFHGGNLVDTLGDLLADLTGGTLFTAWALLREER